MKYETQMKFDKHLITEEYVVDGRVYSAELTIFSLGYCAGMAGYEASRVGVSLSRQKSKKSVGEVIISFPLLKRSDRPNPCMMLEPCPKRGGFKGNMPSVRKFTPYAERVIERVVTEFIRQREAYIAMGFPLQSITVSVGEKVRSEGKE